MQLLYGDDLSKSVNYVESANIELVTGETLTYILIIPPIWNELYFITEFRIECDKHNKFLDGT